MTLMPIECARLIFGVALLAALRTAVPASAAEAPGDAWARQTEAGIAAYSQGRYDDAARAFGAVLSQASRDARES